jgi:hypothetical protein
MLSLGLVAGPSPEARADAPLALDRVIVRWHAPETGGAKKPQFIYERELSFEARVEAMIESDKETSYKEPHVRAALDRHIAETILASLPVVPAPTPKQVAQRAEAARGILEQRVHGRDRLIAAAAADGISSDELDAVLRRQARASIYLDKMVAPMLEASEADLREVWRSGASPYKEMSFDQAAPLLAKWVVGQRLAQAVETYFQSARSRVVVVVAK